MKLTLILLQSILLATLISLHAADESKRRPNIIFVLFDDMGYGQPKCYREGTEFKTPNLDLLAREGKACAFTDAHSAASVYARPRATAYSHSADFSFPRP